MPGIKFGEIYWRSGSAKPKSADKHYFVILGYDAKFKLVLYQTLTSRIEKIFQFPRCSSPSIDVDTSSFLNFRKYPGILFRDTSLVMWYGIQKEQEAVFFQKIKQGFYKKRGMLSDHNKRALMVSIIPSRNYNLSSTESLQIKDGYDNLK